MTIATFSVLMYRGLFTLAPPIDPTNTPEPPVPAPAPLPTQVAPTPSMGGTTIINQVPGTDGTTPHIDSLSSFGLGAVIAAIIGGLVLYYVEGRRQNGENARKLMELKRQDERQWDNDLRKHFVDARKQLRALDSASNSVRLYATQPSTSQSEVNFYFAECLKIRNELNSIADDVAIIANDSVVGAFRSAVELATSFLERFGKNEHFEPVYPENRVKDFIDISPVEDEMLKKVRAALKTPESMDSANIQINGKREAEKKGKGEG